MPELRPNQNANGSCTGLECVSSGTIRKFEWILRQFKEETRRLSSAKSSLVTPKLRIKEFLRHTLRAITKYCDNYRAADTEKVRRPVIFIVKQHMRYVGAFVPVLANPIFSSIERFRTSLLQCYSSELCA